jgi:CheY-like chemotaxis protein
VFKSTKILIVEDNEINIRIASLLLNELGFTDITVAKNGQEALALIDDDIELVLLDIGLPDMDGFEVCKLMRKTLKKKIPIIAVTTLIKISDEKYKLAGIDDVIAKPIEMHTLNKKIHQWLNRK